MGLRLQEIIVIKNMVEKAINDIAIDNLEFLTERMAQLSYINYIIKQLENKIAGEHK